MTWLSCAILIFTAVVCGHSASVRPRRHHSEHESCSSRSASNISAAAPLPLLVKFKHYAPWQSHAAALEKHVSSSRRGLHLYRVVERQNAAARYPTDFLLIELPAASADGRANSDHRRLQHVVSHVSTLQALRGHAEVAGVYPQRSYSGHRRTLFSASDAEEAPGGTATFANSTHPQQRWRRRHLQGSDRGEAQKLNARNLWVNGAKGGGVRVAVLDSGMPRPGSSKAFGQGTIRERTDWTNDGTPDDLIGHGTFVGGVIGGLSPECMGFAPEAEIHSFKVFNKGSHAYTSWFIDAFNYAIFRGIHILNLSVGGPDWLDTPFVEKVQEMSAAGIIVVSAIGNDGPSWGTSVNPADMMDVIGVGGARSQGMLAPFSSRGMTKHELASGGYGRVKPDVITHAERLWGPSLRGGCTKQSGTSVASPVVAGALALLASTLAPEERWKVLNPGSAKQILHEGAQRHHSGRSNALLFEEGAGTMDLMSSKQVLDAYKTPRASFFPPSIDMAQNPCGSSWPWCTQPLYASAIPTTLNITIISALAARSYITAPPIWEVLSSSSSSSSGGSGDGSSEDTPKVEVGLTEYSAVLWPWSGFLAIRLHVPSTAARWSGSIEGRVKLTVSTSPTANASKAVEQEKTVATVSEITLPLKLLVVPTPARSHRLLWDQRHSLSYPPGGFIPKDSFEQTDDFLDWHGDHPHTNYKGMYEHLRASNYFLEILSPGESKGFQLFDAADYSALLVVDPEEEFTVDEVEKLATDVKTHGLSLLVFADWFDIPTIQGLRFLDDNTHRYWTPCTGGANVPALNDLLEPYGVAFGAGTLGGEWSLGGQQVATTPSAQGLGGGGRRQANMCQGVPIARFPPNGRVWTARLQDHTTKRAMLAPVYGITAPGEPDTSTTDGGAGQRRRRRMPPIPASATGLSASVSPAEKPDGESDAGIVAVYGDSNCLDSSHLKGPPCYWLLDEMLSVLPTTSSSAGGNTMDRLSSLAGGQVWSELLSQDAILAKAATDALPRRESSQLGAFRAASALWRESKAAVEIAAAADPIDEMAPGFT